MFGAIAAVRAGVPACLVGDVSAPRRVPSGFTVVRRGEAFPMGAAAASVRRSQDASIRVALRLHREGRASCVFSAGHSGAALVAAVLELGVIPGVERPALATVLPRADGGRLVLVDSGANVDCRSEQLASFAVLGSAFAEVIGVSRPRVGLLSIGEEPGKGNDQVRAARPLLERAPVRFVGNVEPTGALAGGCDVVVCDGFVGNVLLKGVEAAADTVAAVARRELLQRRWARLAAFLARRRLARLRDRLAWEAAGGALLLGVRGVVVVGHGRSGPEAVHAGIRLAARAAADGLVAAVERRVGEATGR
jgi:glycerol-3-phosphate acyltransferase PlsX